jgi:hypothetical protein
MSKFFYSHPKGDNKLAMVGDIMKQIQAFDLLFELGPDGSVNNCNNSETSAQWRKFVREGVVQNMGRPVEVDFFEKLAGGETEDIDATSIYIKSNQDINYNIYSQNSVVAGAPGDPVTFTMARELHSGQGKFSNVAAGGMMFIPEDGQMVYIDSIDTTTDYAHTVTIKPFRAEYAPNVRKGTNMLFNQSRIVGAYSCPVPSVQWMSNGFIRGVQGFRYRGDWEIKVELDKAYQEVMQFAIIFDKEGKAIDSFEWKAKSDMRWNMRLARNLFFFLGQKVTNPALQTAVVDDKFPGFEGYEPTLKYGGGFVYQYPKSQGFSPNGDLTPIMLRQDARKKSMEYMVLDGFPFRLMMQNRANVDFSKFTGACTFETFERMGADKDEITKLGVTSWNYAGASLHFKNMDSLSDERVLGSYDYPYRAYMMPTQNLTDSNGRNVPAIEFFKPKGYGYEEYEIDNRKVTKCESITGWAVDVCMSTVHEPDNHIFLQPRAY